MLIQTHSQRPYNCTYSLAHVFIRPSPWPIEWVESGVASGVFECTHHEYMFSQEDLFSLCHSTAPESFYWMALIFAKKAHFPKSRSSVLHLRRNCAKSHFFAHRRCREGRRSLFLKRSRIVLFISHVVSRLSSSALFPLLIVLLVGGCDHRWSPPDLWVVAGTGLRLAGRYRRSDRAAVTLFDAGLERHAVAHHEWMSLAFLGCWWWCVEMSTPRGLIFGREEWLAKGRSLGSSSSSFRQCLEQILFFGCDLASLKLAIFCR